MKYLLTGKEGLQATWQEDFPETTKCVCGGKSYHIFTYYEGLPTEKKDKKKEEFICNTPPRGLKKKDLWVHDCCSCAIYLCSSCLKITGEINQA